MPLYIRKCNITDINCDAMINASDEKLSGVCGVDRAMRAAAGPQLAQACAEIGHCDIGDAVITPGFELCKYVIHIAPPTWVDGRSGELELLASCYKRALELAKEKGCRSVALTIVSGKQYGFIPNDNLRVAVETANKFLELYNMEIIIATYRKSTFNIGMSMYSENATAVGIDKYRLEQQRSTLEELLNRDTESFGDLLVRKIAEKGMSNSECYTKALTTKSVFSSIRTKRNYTPKKETVTGFVFALELPIDEALKLFAAAGYYLNKNNDFDVIVEYFIENYNFDLFELNETLADYGLRCIGSN